MKSVVKAAVVLLVGLTAALAQTPAIQFQNGVFRVTGWDFDSEREPAGGWEATFPVYTTGNKDQPILGTYSVEGRALVFRPRFPISPGVGYQADFQPAGRILAGAVFDAPPPPAPSTRVTHVYPSADILPSNELKLYLYFSAPMSRGEAWQHIHLLDESGKAVDLVFLEIDQELWDPDNQRLTVLFDPGRIKRGLVPAKQLGMPIKEGKRYTLVVDRDWHDARGVALSEGYRKEFRGGPVDRTTPDPKLWRLTAPQADTREPLVVKFPKPMDYALLQRLIEVSGVEGTVAIGLNETEWRFTPREAWKPGSYTLTADKTLEDISGNHLDRAFDVDTSTKPAAPASAEKTVSIPFRVL